MVLDSGSHCYKVGIFSVLLPRCICVDRISLSLVGTTSWVKSHSLSQEASLLHRDLGEASRGEDLHSLV